MGHLEFGGMQRLNIEAARKQAGQDLLQTPNPGLTTSGSGTPISLSTPDILNSIIAISNPFFENTSVPDETETLTPGDFDDTTDKKVFANLDDAAPTIISSTNSGGGGPTTSSSCVYSTSSSGLISCGSPMSVTSSSTTTLSETGVCSPTSSHPPPPPHQSLLPQLPTPSTSVESMRSKLIKDSLKLTIQTKRKNSGKEELDVKSELVTKRPKREEVELTYDFSPYSNDSIANESHPPTKLTPEDEERRRRRRERNKVAATKCRNKKKEKTVLLVQDAEALETDNVSLKTEIAQMEEELKRLSSLWTSHIPNCTLNEMKPVISAQPQQSSAGSHQHSHPHHQHQQHQHQLQHQDLLQSNSNNMMGSSSSVPPPPPYSSASTGQQQHQEYVGHQQDLNSHMGMGSNNHHYNNMNMGYFGPMHHQTIQLS